MLGSIQSERAILSGMLSAAGNEQAVYVYVDLSSVEAQHAPQAGSEMTLKARLLSTIACRT